MRNVVRLSKIKIRVAQTNKVDFKHQKFISAKTDSYSLVQKHYRNAKILKIGQNLDMSVCDQSFTS